jgi:hypothetical protein
LEPERQAPSIVCGMTLIPGDTAIDPLIVRPPQAGRFVIPAVPPRPADANCAHDI